MRTTLDHLPEPKQREIQTIVDLLQDEFKRVYSNKTSQAKLSGRILKIILFGSHAKDTIEIGRVSSDGPGVGTNSRLAFTFRSKSLSYRAHGLI